MKKYLHILAGGLIGCLVFFFASTSGMAPSPSPLAAEGPCQTLWTKAYGGSQTDSARAIAACHDGGTAIAGFSRSWGLGETDFYIFKLDPQGKLKWSKFYGIFDSNSNSIAYGITETADNGLVVVGELRIYSILDDLGLTASYRYNIWVLKLDSKGNWLWSRTYGGKDYDRANSIRLCADGGFILAGHTQSFGAEYKPEPHAKKDLWIIKLDRDGNKEWERLFGKPEGADGAQSIRQCRDGGYIAAGFTSSFGAGSYDALLLKLDSRGTVQWWRTFGSPGFDQANDVVETSTGNFMVVGETSVKGADNTDFLALCYNPSGDLLWSRTYGGPGFERGRAIVETADHNFLLAGYTDSWGAGNKDAWLVKIDPAGNMLWHQTLGYKGCDEPFGLAATPDGNYVLAGNTSYWDHGEVDAWAVKIKDLSQDMLGTSVRN